MTKQKLQIALIYGGRGAEHAVSLSGAEYVMSVLDGGKYDILPILIERDGRWILYGGEVCPICFGGSSGLYNGDRILPIDCVIPLLHGEYGEDGRIQGALDTAGIPYIGADTVAGGVCIDKGITRAIARAHGIPTAQGITLPRHASLDDARAAVESIGYPIFIKPTRQGSSIGASAVWEDEELPSAFARAAIYGAVLIEELVTGKRELEVGILSHKGRCTVSPVGEVLCHGFYDYDKKYGGATGTVCPADIDDRTAEKIKKYALTLTDAIDIRGTARIDFFLSGDKVLFNEINTMPGFTRDSLYPELMRAAGIPTARLFDLLIGDAIG